jgi:predicted ATPase/class 3 adenylate cyclase
MAHKAPHPTGTVTLLFTDIEGSTQHWEQQRAAMPDALRRHDELLRAAIEAHSGYIFKTVGDAFCAAFSRASCAVAAAADAQRGLASADWSAVGGLAVRMALHSGATDERDGDYFGPAVNRVARLMAIGHGGQILLSGATRELTHGDLPAGTVLVDLGEQRLHDLTDAEHVWQIDVAGLPSEFPSLRSLDALPNNLPISRTTFVGRERDVAEVKGLLEHHRLLTLVGSGGVGKTRLAIQVGAELLDRYPDGAWFVDFAPINDPELVASIVAQALGMSQQEGRRIDEAIPQWLRRKKLLVIFDNCEHVLEPTAALADNILATAPDVRILSTSRERLDVIGEAVHRLPSLAVPAEAAGLTPDEALRYGAVALFVDRAKAADTRFTLTDDGAPIVAQICQRLDGIALAIELAAARVKMLSIPNLAQRLNERFKLLTGGSRTALPRQKTLGALIDWSYDLLASQEQLLFARLGIFAGGFGLDAVKAVCKGGLDDVDVFAVLESLTDKSLVVADTGGERERYRLLESTAAYALEKLGASGQGERLARRHAEYFRDEAEAADEWLGVSTIAWLAAVEPELDNYRTALEWALTLENDAVLGGAIAGAIERLWWHAGLVVEGRYWIGRALPRVDEAEQPRIAARLWLAQARLLPGKGRYDAAERALRLYESVGDVRGAARALRLRGYALYQMGRLDEAQETTALALSASRTCADSLMAGDLLVLQASIEMSRGDFGAARELYAQALAGWKSTGDELGTASVLGSMAEMEFAAGDPAQALRWTNEALELGSLGKNLSFAANWRVNSAAYRIALGDVTGARESGRAGLRLARQARSELFLATALQHLALVAALAGDTRRGARLLGYVDAKYSELGMKREITEQWGHDKLLAVLRETISEDEIKNLAAEGAAWLEDHAIEEALEV